MARPTIGDFRGTEQNKPRTSAPAPVEETPPASEAPTTTEAVPSENPFPELTSLTPAERYRAQLKAVNLDHKSAELIYDAVLSKGYYEEYIRIRGDHRAVFRTRMYEDHLRLQTILEMQKPQLAISQDELITRYNLASSLYEWEGKKLEHKDDNDFDKINAMLRKLPGPLFTVLSRELSKFDAKVMAVFSEGADENFS